MTLTNWLLIIAIVSPLALLPLLRPPAWRKGVLRLAPLGALPALLLALFGLEGEGVPLPWIFLGAELGLDDTGRIFLLFTAWLWILATWFAVSDRRLLHGHLFLLFWLSAMAGNFGLILARDLITFNVFFTLMGLSAYGLIIHRRKPFALRAGRIYLSLVLLGEVLIFIGLVGLVWQSGGGVQLNEPGATEGIPFILALSLLLGFGIKAGILPLHFWLPLAHPAAPVPASAVLSGCMIKAGLLGWLRFLPGGGDSSLDLAPFCLLTGLLATFYGVVRGLGQQDPKTVLAWSSVSQMGVLTVGLGLWLGGGAGRETALAATVIFAAHHALAKGALFLTVGVADENPKPARLLALIPALSLAGAPFSSGFVAKNLLLEATTNPVPRQIGPFDGSRGLWSLLLSVGSVLTALLMLHFLHRLVNVQQHHPLQRSAKLTCAGRLPPQKGVSRVGLLPPLLLLILSGLPPLWQMVPPLAELLNTAPPIGTGKAASALLPLLSALLLARPVAKLLKPGANQGALSKQADIFTAILHGWQHSADRAKNLQAAIHCRHHHLSRSWNHKGRRLEEVISSWPTAGCCSLALVLLLFLLLR